MSIDLITPFFLIFVGLLIIGRVIYLIMHHTEYTVLFMTPVEVGSCFWDAVVQVDYMRNDKVVRTFKVEAMFEFGIWYNRETGEELDNVISSHLTRAKRVKRWEMAEANKA